jgi:hypothetical protein
MNKPGFWDRPVTPKAEFLTWMTSFILIAVVGCVTVIHDEQVLKEKANLKYKVGDCVNVFDPETGKGRKDEIVKIEAIKDNVYHYRWWLPQREWALDLNSGIGKAETFEKMTYLSECP